MDYEKEYKSLVAKVKKAHQFAQTDSTKKVLEDILPELRESEDERIKRELIEYLKGDLDDITTDDTDRWINWIEKQKELLFVKDVMLGYPGLYFYDGERMHFRGPTMEEKQKEQKPAEWSEEDKKLLDFWLDVIDRNDWRMDENFCKASREFINRLKSLRPHPQLHWKPSEEQMDRLFSIVAALRKDYCDDMADFLANLYADLKKLGVKEEPEYYQHFDPDC